MACTKVMLVLLLVTMVAMDSANCYFRLGREMEGRRRVERPSTIKNVEKIVLQRILNNVARCVMQVRSQWQYTAPSSYLIHLICF